MGPMVFRNYGGNYQLRIETAEDLAQVLELPEVHWAATSAPIGNLDCDRAFLDFLDSDGNGRVRTDEVRGALAWAFHMLVNRACLVEQSDVLQLADVDTSHSEGQLLRASAERILANLELVEAREITLAQVRDVKSITASAASNGDGVIPPEAAEDAETAEFIRAVMQCAGSVADAGGEKGITKAQLETFVKEATAFLEWEAKGCIPDGAQTTDVHPWGAETAAAWQAIAALDAKIAEYFTQCDMVRLDERLTGETGLREKELAELDFTDEAALAARMSKAPLAPPNADGTLELRGKTNPAYEQALGGLRDNVLERALGGSPTALDGEQWAQVKAVFDPYRAWLADKPETKTEQLGRDAVAAVLAGPCIEQVTQLIAADRAVADQLRQVRDVEKLIVYQQWLFEFVNNFVSLPRLYDPTRRALFERGTLIIDGRELTFSTSVPDRAKHRELAEDSNMHILYVEVTGRASEEIKFEVVTAVTSGDSVGLRVGKRGVFFTPDGREWDACVVEIIDNPVSLSEAIKAPFQKAAKALVRQFEKFSAAQQAKIEAAVAAPKASTATRDMLLAGSVGIAALGSSFAYITQALAKVELHQVLLVLLGIAVIILGPSVLMGYFKLRRRDLTTLLEAAGWAINIRMKLTSRLGRLFTKSRPLPPGAVKERDDLVVGFVGGFDADALAINWWRVTFISLTAAVLLMAWLLWEFIRLSQLT
ncbi:hypothetical protein ACFL34_02155 [Candidatus Sumerlaeota bacterium]